MLLPMYMQFKIILFGLLSGIIIGMLYDVYRIIRGDNLPIVFKFCEDILFWILCSIIVFTFLLYNNYAIMGTYIYVLLLVGVIIYLKFFSKTIFNLERTIGNSIMKSVRIAYKNISYVIRLLLYKNKSEKK
ncbi:hypothetical protein rsdtw13_39890 [Clostridium sp. TW13]|uniref:Uncharacterized protein n=1 Tax=Inconstantimicrobium mannanitabidum TaxID=1604901 RepID=A0ACB5RHY0_9CLOT|nr:hypothetical protein rsdtw13_39890 [Clostridium sp. TW13]